MVFGKRVLKANPAILILASFLLTIAVGTLLLMLPVSTRGGSIPLVDALFTATSAVCVTGLVVVETGSYFTLFGQWVIVGLIQVGGLGLMTISVALFRWFGLSVAFRNRMAMQDLFTHTPRADIFNLVKSAIFFTLSVEAAGALLLTIRWSQDMAVSRAAFNGVFHSVSAFCNAGFGLFPGNLVCYQDSWLVNLTVCGLIVIGGIGFPVLYDLKTWLTQRKHRRVRLAVQTKTVLLVTLFLIVGGALIIGLLERQTLLESHSVAHTVLVPLFQSITCRTAGFNTVDIASLTDATLSLMIFLMFVGASPGSTGGGVKTTTLALLAAFTWSRVWRRGRVNLFKKSIPAETLGRSISLILTSLAIIGVVVFLILVSDPGGGSAAAGRARSALGYLFEVVSAFGTVGLSMGVTPLLSVWGKCLIVMTMIIGRVGVLTFAYIVVGAGPFNGIEYSEENLMIG